MPNGSASSATDAAPRASRPRIARRVGSEGRRGGEAGDYEDWTKEELYDKAKDVGIEGRSHMTKKDLIHSLRSH